ncbi:1700011M02Rik [Phodopus roborovskii]|uniref:1700011M02Rik protein n=1 Tax=Phodopus roborovskii TaxID=109678 RepID=A0AAU9YZJ9_PHORO|nr:1700011M02Rik [Phodopus roborovskii]
MVFLPFFTPPGQTPRNPLYFQRDVVFAHAMENSSNGSRGTRAAAPPRRTWKGRFQRALARMSKFFRRGCWAGRG